MSFFKKNLLFCIVALLCIAAFAVGAFLAYSQYGKSQQAQRSLRATESQLSSLLNQDPAPTRENLAAAESNLNELQQALDGIRQNLQRGAVLTTSEDGVSVMAGIQQYISKFQRMAARYENEFGELAPVQTEKDFAFGFEQYIDEAAVLENAEKVSLLDKQRQILDYLMTKLIQAGPHSVDSVGREILELENVKQGTGFSIDPAISARVPGAIDTIAFSLTFSGYTDALRQFLNSLASFELPIVVRSIEVERPSGSETVVAPAGSVGGAGLFDFFDEEETTVVEQPQEAQKPVIEENISRFTVILEFIEVLLPEAQNENDF